MADFGVLTFCRQELFCSGGEDWLAGRQLSRLAAGAACALQNPREQQHLCIVMCFCVHKIEKREGGTNNFVIFKGENMKQQLSCFTGAG